jgi:hypothetical protein
VEAIMSSPIHHPEDLDTALRYAPPWARRPASGVPATAPPPAERLPRSQRLAGTPRGFSGDLAMAELQRQLALNPDTVPQPPRDSPSSLWPMARRLGAVFAVAALAAWGIVALPAVRKPANDNVQNHVAPASFAANRVKLVHISSANAPPLTGDALDEVKDLPWRVGTPVPAPQPVPPPPPPRPPDSTPTLDTEEIATLLKRGQDLLQSGDLASARLLLRRAAEAGSASAALVLGTTFDPLVIGRLGVIGIEPDTARARTWYQKAVELGSAAASQQLANLERAR